MSKRYFLYADRPGLNLSKVLYCPLPKGLAHMRQTLAELREVDWGQPVAPQVAGLIRLRIATFLMAAEPSRGHIVAAYQAMNSEGLIPAGEFELRDDIAITAAAIVAAFGQADEPDPWNDPWVSPVPTPKGPFG